MESQAIERRLAAILCADAVGYSRLMGADEVGTHARFQELRREFIEPLVADYRGNIFKFTGDGFLVEFHSVVDAVKCAVAWQQGLYEHRKEVADEQRLRFRIGINLGDVIVGDEDIHGEGVNVAARLEGFAEPSGICVSGKVYQEVKDKLPFGYESLGERKIKNIADPVRIYRVKAETLAGRDRLSSSAPPPLPDKPSIAVLPFINMSGDLEQEYFSDGITEDIITELSRFHSLFVIARNSSFAFKNTAIDVREIAHQLGVRYVLEGSVRKANDRVRVTAQLVEATTGSHIWAERYDRALEDIFAVQDEVTRNIATTLVGRIEDAGAEQAGRKPTDDLMAYDYILRGGQQLNLFTEEGIENGTEHFAKAIELDPQCARAYAGLGLGYQLRMWIFGTFEDDFVRLAHDNAQKALSLDSNDSLAHAILCDLYLNSGRHDRAGDHIKKAVALNPNDSFAAWEMVFYLAYIGRPEEAIEWAQTAIRQNPYHPDWYLEFLGDAYYMAKRYDEAIETFESWNNRPFWINAELAACYAQAGRFDDACAELEAYERAHPEGSTLEDFFDTHRQVCKIPGDWEHWLEGYRKAGVET